MLDKLPMREQRRIVMQKVEQLNRIEKVKIAKNMMPLTVHVDHEENKQLYLIKQLAILESEKKDTLNSTLSDLKTQANTLSPPLTHFVDSSRQQS